jgi:Ca2+/Na+ antiporter
MRVSLIHLIIITLLLLAYVIWSEYGSQDMLHKTCHNSTLPMNESDSLLEGIDKTIETVRKNHTLVNWRLAFFVALITVFPISFFLLHRSPSGFSYLVILLLIFIIVYFAFVWTQAQWWGKCDSFLEEKLYSLRKRFLSSSPIRKKEIPILNTQSRQSHLDSY